MFSKCNVFLLLLTYALVISWDRVGYGIGWILKNENITHISGKKHTCVYHTCSITQQWGHIGVILGSYSWTCGFPIRTSDSKVYGTGCQTIQPAMQLDTLAALGHDAMKLLNSITQKANTWFLSLTEEKEPSLPSSTKSSNGISTSAPCTEDSPQESREYPENFEPIRSRCLVDLQTPCTPIMKNPFVSPLLAPDNLLKGLPPVHLVVRYDNGAYKSVNC